MLAVTTKEMIDQSISFKLAFGGAIGAFVSIFILSIVVVSSSCDTYYSCYDHYYPF